MTVARRLSRIALVIALAAAAPAAAQNFTVALSPASAPLANAATQNVASSVSFDVTNTRAGTTISQIDFVLPKFWPSTGGAGPPGWTVVSVSEHNNNTTVRFAVSTCGQGGLANGATGTFRLDLTGLTNPALTADGTDTFYSIAPADPCGGTTGWTPFGPSIIPVKVLWLTASASPAAGASPLATTVTFTVTNETSVTKTVLAPAPTVSPATSFTTTGCAPASLTLAAGASGSFGCGYVFSPTAATSYTVAAAVASSPAGSSAAGAVAGPILVGPATATFAFDRLSAASGD
ncbi:MAG TPA: hypothetical protein VEP68_01685, partial [Anaeromyxobacteraceae bacterium]|nr:hypothetical protein [Anaeromyxobacteraceae bacterium]